jgi:hypothetical protein
MACVTSAANGVRETPAHVSRVLWPVVASVALLALANAIAFVPYTASGSHNRSSAVRALFDGCRGDNVRAWSDESSSGTLGPREQSALRKADAAQRVCTRSARIRLIAAGAAAVVGSVLFLWVAVVAWRTTGRRIRSELAAEGR